MKIVQLVNNEKYIEQCAALLISNFNTIPNMETALDIVRRSLDDSKINLISINDKNEILGWICGIENYNLHVWEIQPLVVKESFQNKGLGRLLLSEFDKEVYKRNGVTIILGIQDENHETSLSDVDIYDNTLKKIKKIKNLKHNPYEFYLKNGFTIVGVIPDSNGIGKPDILMSKRVNGQS